MTVIRRRLGALGKNENQVLERDAASPEAGRRGLPVIHPFLIALIPILHIVASNPGQARFSDALIPILISLGFTLAALVILRLVLKDWEAAGLIVSLFLVLFFSTGHLVDFVLKQVSPRSPLVLLIAALFAFVAAGVLILFKFRDRLRNRTPRTYVIVVVLFLAGLVCLLFLGALTLAYPRHLLFAGICVILAAGVFLVLRFRDRLRNPTRILNVFAVVLMVLVLVNLFTSTQKDVAIRTDEVRQAAESKDVALPNPAELPDVYYIVLDAYGSERLLSEHFGYDNSEFISWLESRGFYVVPDSHSNYNHTYMSLASSLNMKYINYVSKEVGERSLFLTPLRLMIEDNSLVRYLKSRGYKFAFFGTGFPATRFNRYADISQVENWVSSEFMITLLKSTVFRCFSPTLATRESVPKTFANIPLTRSRVKGPLFLFAHIPSPHPPYLFDRNGEPMKLSDDTKAMYLEQLMYVNKELKEMVDQILSVSERQPVIVIQGDHGPSIDKKDETNYTLEPLNALRVPGAESLLYQSMTPVNSFRIILNSIFGTSFSIVEDNVFISSPKTPYDFKDITKTLGGEQ